MKMNVWEQLIEVLTHHVILLLFLTIFLYFIHASTKISRTVMGLLALFGMLFDLILRIIISKRLSGRSASEDSADKLLLVAAEGEETPAPVIERYAYVNGRKDVRINCKVADTVMLSDKNGLPALLMAAKNKDYDMIYLSAKAASLIGPSGSKELESAAVPICMELSAEGKTLSADRVISVGGNAALYHSLMTKRYRILDVEYTAAGIAETAAYLLDHSEELCGRYVCFSNVHTTIMADDDKDYRDILNGSAATFPDGKPLADRIAAAGYEEAERVAGPDLMAELFRCSRGSGKKHYFYGSTQETLDALKKHLSEVYPFMEIAGMYSPPFRDLTEEEDKEIVERINASGADFVWIGLGAPRQERWMAAHKGRINALMLGVGAGFDFHAGTVKRAPLILQKLGLEWLYRLFQDPRRLIKRYLVTNTKFILRSLR